MADNARAPRLHRSSSAGLAIADAVLVLLVPALLAGMFGLPMLFGEHWNSDGPFYHAIALKAAREGHWWPLMQGDLPYLLKPPLAYWMHAAFDKLLGEHDWVFGLPDLLVFAACCALTASIAAKFHGKRIGIVAGCILAVSWEWIVRISNFRLDFLHTLLLLGAVRCAIEIFLVRTNHDAHDKPLEGAAKANAWATLGAGLCVGLAMMTKPIFGILLLPILGLWMWWCGRRAMEVAGRVLLMAIVALAVALPWHVDMLRRYGHEFYQTYWTTQSYERLTGHLFHPEPWYWYAKYMFIRTDGSDPTWTRLVVLAACLGVGLMCRRRTTSPPNFSAGDRLVLLWTLGWGVLFSAFPGKHNYYFLLVYPGLAWLAALPLTWVFDFLRQPRRLTWITAGSVAAMIVIGAWRWPPIYRPRATLETPMARVVQFVNNHPKLDEVWNGSLGYWESSLIYVKSHRWPRSPVGKQSAPPAAIPHGAVVIYDKQRAPGPQAGDNVLLDAARFTIVKHP